MVRYRKVEKRFYVAEVQKLLEKEKKMKISKEPQKKKKKKKLTNTNKVVENSKI